jgi:hypothetical protein
MMGCLEIGMTKALVPVHNLMVPSLRKAGRGDIPVERNNYSTQSVFFSVTTPEQLDLVYGPDGKRIVVPRDPRYLSIHV